MYWLGREADELAVFCSFVLPASIFCAADKDVMGTGTGMQGDFNSSILQFYSPTTDKPWHWKYLDVLFTGRLSFCFYRVCSFSLLILFPLEKDHPPPRWALMPHSS